MDDWPEPQSPEAVEQQSEEMRAMLERSRDRPSRLGRRLFDRKNDEEGTDA